MGLTIRGLLILIALVWTLVHAAGRVPLWPAVLILIVEHLIGAWPL
jgi:hypothetical protein